MRRTKELQAEERSFISRSSVLLNCRSTDAEPFAKALIDSITAQTYETLSFVWQTEGTDRRSRGTVEDTVPDPRIRLKRASE